MSRSLERTPSTSAAHLGVPKGVARHLVRSRAIPWFTLAGVACSRRSTLAAHFAELEELAAGLTNRPA